MQMDNVNHISKMKSSQYKEVFWILHLLDKADITQRKSRTGRKIQLKARLSNLEIAT